MAGIPAAPNKDIAGKGGHDDCEKCAGQDEQGLNHVDELADTRVRYHVNIAQQMIPPPPRGSGEPEYRQRAGSGRTSCQKDRK